MIKNLCGNLIGQGPMAVQVIIWIVLLVGGFVMLIKGADWFVEGAAKVAKKFGIPEIVIGLTIVAMGTSLPEAAVSISSAIKGSADITIGNVLGSNIMNVLLILGITALVCNIPVKKPTLMYELPFVIIVTALIAGLGLTDNVVGRVEGIILWVFFIAYILYLAWRSKKGDELEEAPGSDKPWPIWKMIVFILLGAGMIVVGSDVTVDAATELATMAGMSERLIGLTIIAFGTSLPELVTSVTAARKKSTDIAIGNIVGSNIFNILFVAGTTAIVTPVPYQGSFLIDSIVAVATMVLLLVLLLPKKRLGKVSGIIMVLAYAGYFTFMIMNGKS